MHLLMIFIFYFAFIQRQFVNDVLNLRLIDKSKSHFFSFK